MTSHVCDWRIELIHAHRGLFRPPANAPVLAQGYPDCGPGWRDLLDKACARISASLAAEERVEILLIKEKYGTLRLYWQGKLSNGSRRKVEQAVALAQARSACTCDQCGEHGRLFRKGGVLMTRCASHAQGEPVPAEPGQENVHLVQIPTSEGYRIAARRYDRETDSFADVPSGPIKIGEE